MLDFRMESFLTVCQTRNMTRAAEQLHITQPAVSHHIKSLEEEYGAKLFSYQGKKLQLTDAGKMLWEAGLTIRRDADLLRQRIRSIRSRSGTLRFGATLTVGEYAMAPVLSSYLKRYPQARITMQVADTKQLLERMDSGEIDFAIVEGFFPQSSYDSLLFRRERFLPVCGKEYIFRTPVNEISDLLGERLLVREEGSGTRRILETYLESRNLSIQDFQQRTEIGNIAVLKELTKDGCGVTFLYEAAVRKELEEGSLREIPLQGFQIQHDFSFLWRKNSLFADHYREIYRLLQEEADTDWGNSQNETAIP